MQALTPHELHSLQAAIQFRQSLLEKLCTFLSGLLRHKFEPHEIDPDTALFGSGLGMDSVDAVDLVVGLETYFGVRLEESNQDRQPFRTVNTLLDRIIVSHLEQGRANTRPLELGGMPGPAESPTSSERTEHVHGEVS